MHTQIHELDRPTKCINQSPINTHIFILCFPIPIEHTHELNPLAAILTHPNSCISTTQCLPLFFLFAMPSSLVPSNDQNAHCCRYSPINANTCTIHTYWMKPHFKFQIVLLYNPSRAVVIVFFNKHPSSSFSSVFFC